MVYPDADLSRSPTLGVVFRLPTHDVVEEGSEHSDYEDMRRSYIRPHSAKGNIFSNHNTCKL